MVIENPLNLWNVLVNELSGSVLIFIFLSTAFIFIFGARFRMPLQITSMIVILWMLILGMWIPGLLIIAIILVAIFVVWQLVKIFYR